MAEIKYKPMYRGYHRMLSGPLDDCSVFYTVEDLVRYVKYGTAYSGQHIVLIDKTRAKNTPFEFILVEDNDVLKLYPLFNFTYRKMANDRTGILVYRHDFDFTNSSYEYSMDNLCILNNENIYSICNLVLDANAEFPEPITETWIQNFAPFEDSDMQGLHAYDNKWTQTSFEIDLFSASSVEMSKCYIEFYLGVDDTIIYLNPLFD